MAKADVRELVAGILTPARHNAQHLREAHRLMPGTVLRSPRSAAAAGHLPLLQRMLERGETCCRADVDEAGRRGQQEVVRLLEARGVLRTRAIVMELYAAVLSDQQWWRALDVDNVETVDPVDHRITWFGVQFEGNEVVAVSLTRQTIERYERPRSLPVATIPESLGSLTALRNLDLRNNALRGTIPECLSELTNLVHLDLGCNELEGRIPPGLSACLQMYHLVLYDNRLSGPIPETLGALVQLHTLLLANNRLTGTIPESLTQCTSLWQLHLQNNRLTGRIPEGLHDMPSRRNRGGYHSFRLDGNPLSWRTWGLRLFGRR